MSDNTVKVALPVNNGSAALFQLVINDATEARILEAYKVLHSAVASYGKDALPSFDDMSGDAAGRERIAARSLRALIALSTHRQEENVRAFRQGVKDAIAPYIEEQSKARATYMAVPKEVRQFLPAFPTNVYIPLDAVSDVFPTGTAAEAQVKVLHTLKYKVSKKDSKTFIVVELPTS